MGRLYCICAVTLLAIALLAISRFGETVEKRPPSTAPQKIISLAPAITETLYVLGLGEKIAGVTAFCAWPPEACEKPKTGGFLEVNLEPIARARADLVILPTDMAHHKKQIEDMGISVLLFNYHSLEKYLKDVLNLGKLCHIEKRAEEFVERFEKMNSNYEEGKKASVLFVLLNPDEYDRPIREATIIGTDGFYNEVINAAGGKNAYEGKALFPRMSLEAMIALDPDIIVVGAPEAADRERLAQRWEEIGKLKGTSNGRLVLLTDPGDTIPGPRSLGTIKKLSQTIQAIGLSDNIRQ